MMHTMCVYVETAQIAPVHSAILVYCIYVLYRCNHLHSMHVRLVLHLPFTTINMHSMPMWQYYICLGIVLTVILVLGLGFRFGTILYFVIGTWSNGQHLIRATRAILVMTCALRRYSRCFMYRSRHIKYNIVT